MSPQRSNQRKQEHGADDGARICAGCGLLPKLCACALLPRLEVDFELVVVRHCAERNKGSNTVRLLRRLLPKTRVLDFGAHEAPFDPRALHGLGDPLVLFPRGERMLEASDLTAGKSLVVLDGTWSQCRRMSRRVPGIRSLPCAGLPSGTPSAWRLRNATEEHMLCTLEATSRAVALSGKAEIAAAMMEALQLVEARGLHARGVINRFELAAREADRAQRSAAPSVLPHRAGPGIPIEDPCAVPPLSPGVPPGSHEPSRP